MKKIVYISLSKLHRNKANLIQTLKTAESIYAIYNNFGIYMPPFKSKLSYLKRLEQIGISKYLPIKFSYFLHSNWKIFNYIPFILLHKKELFTSYIYVRSHYISRGLIRLKIPHIFEVHDIDKLIKEGFWNYLLRGIDNRIILKIVAISGTLRDTLLNRGIGFSNIYVIPSGVQTQLFFNIMGLSYNRLYSPTLLHIGTLNQERGYNIIEGLAKRGYRIICAGQLDSLMTLNNNIEYLGIVAHKDIPKIYEKGEIALIPYQENLDTINSCSPLKLIEAMAAGRAIIASDIKPIREVIKDGREGILVSPSDIQAWVDAIETLKRNPELAIEMSKRAREKAKNFDWKKRAERIISLFKG
jgi:glycosyltransferase involved in cell wall biosynthesis